MDLYLCRHLLPVSSPPVLNGAAVAVEHGRIQAAGKPGEVRKEIAHQEHGPVEEHDLGDQVLIPGLVNAHTHLELCWIGRENLVLGDYISWLRSLLETRAAKEAEADVAGGIQEGIDRMVRRGTVAIGDISNNLSTVSRLARSPLLGVIFHEIYGIDPGEEEAVMESAAERLGEADRILTNEGGRGKFRLALAPHGPHTATPALLKALAGRAEASKEPFSIHLAESAGEVELLQTGGGEMREFNRERRFMDESWTPPGLSPVAHLDRLGALSPLTLAVHCVHLDRRDLARLQERRCTVVTCPRSNRALQVGKADVPTLLSAGVPVALGTDSLASAPDLDMFAEMKALRDEHPKLAPAAVLRMATMNGARALGLAEELGAIRPGMQAKMVQVPLPSPKADPLETVTTFPETVAPVGAVPAAGDDGS